jgi:hypothetical protein
MANKRTRRAGEKTGQFGRWLTDALIDNPKYRVYYDHGDPQKSDNVAVIKSFIGEEVTNSNRLADVDVMVYNPDHEILLLIEIEESALSPKTLFGDIFANLFSTRFAVRDGGEQKYFSVTPQTHLIIAGFIPRANKENKEKIEEIQVRLREFSFPENTISLENVDLVIDDNLETCIRNLKDKVNEILRDCC